MESTMKISPKHFKFVLTLLATAGLGMLAPITAQAGNVAWAVSVGGEQEVGCYKPL